MIKKTINLIFFMILILSFVCFATPNWINYANSGFSYSPSCKDWLMTSCYPQYNTNFTANLLSESNIFMPIIYPPLSEPLSSSKFLYTFSGSSINVYTADTLEIVSSNVLSGTICAQPQLITDGAGNYFFISSINQSNDLKYSLIEMSNNIDLNEVYIFDLPDNATCDVKNAFPVSQIDNAFLINNDSMYVTNLFNTDTYNYQITNHFLKNYDLKFPNPSSRYFVHDLTNDGKPEIVSVSLGRLSGSVNITLDIFNTDTKIKNSYYSTLDANYGATTNWLYSDINIYPVILGTYSSNPKILVYVNAYQSGSFERDKIMLFSSSGSLLFSYGADGTGNRPKISHPVVSDFNNDGFTDLCFYGGSSPNILFRCYDLTYNLFFNSSIPFNQDFTLGYYYNNSYMDILSYNGVYTFNSTDDWELKESFTTGTGNQSLTIPILLLDKINYSKDIMVIDTTTIETKIIIDDVSVCGDGICSFLENIINCYADCSTTPSESIKTISEYCSNDLECLTGYCYYNKCSQKIGNMACSSDSDCLSLDCANGVCTDAGIVASLTQKKDNTFGGDINSSIFVCVFIMLCILLGLAVVSYKVGTLIPLFIGLAVDEILIIVFAFWGWLPPWILIMNIVLGVLIILMNFLFKRGG